MYKIIIPLQSISDVITNSSSELFCTIFSEKQLESIYKLLSKLFDNSDPEIGPTVSLIDKRTDSYYAEDDYYKDYPDSWIEIDLPYDTFGHIFYEKGLEAVLKDNFNDFKIKFY